MTTAYVQLLCYLYASFSWFTFMMMLLVARHHWQRQRLLCPVSSQQQHRPQPDAARHLRPGHRRRQLREHQEGHGFLLFDDELHHTTERFAIVSFVGEH